MGFFPMKLFKQLGLELSCRGLFVVQVGIIASTGKAEIKKGYNLLENKHSLWI